MSVSNNTSVDTRVYCIFEGAGARGLAHVGVYRALHQANIELVGFAGTSAGAVMATFAALDFEPDQLFDPITGKSILDHIDLDSSNNDVDKNMSPASTPVNVLGSSAWGAINFLRNIPNYIGFYFVIFLISLIPFVTRYYGLLFVFVGFFIFSIFLIWKLKKGLVSLSKVEACLQQLLSMKVYGCRAGKEVTFRDLREKGYKPLRVIASNISNSELRVFSFETTPEVGVAKAICASICIPILFKPIWIEDGWYVDGGVVSNLPAWVFDDERLIDKSAKTVAIEISEKHEDGNSRNKKISWRRILNTILFGAKVLNTRGVDNLEPLRLEVPLGLLDFDYGEHQVKDIISESEKIATAELVQCMIELPCEISAVCEDLRSKCKNIILNFCSFGEDLRLRISIGRPPSLSSKVIKLDYCAGFDYDADENLILPIDRSFVGSAFIDKEAIYIEKKSQSLWEETLQLPQDRWIRNKVSPSLQWILCVPILDKDHNCSFVVSIDCNKEIQLSRNQFDKLLVTLEAEVRLQVKEIPALLEKVHGR